jgi:hypothetical protein
MQHIALPDLNPTIRTYPRTLEEAFPKDDWESVEKSVYKSSPDDWITFVGLFALGFVIGLLLGEM